MNLKPLFTPLIEVTPTVRVLMGVLLVLIVVSFIGDFAMARSVSTTPFNNLPLSNIAFFSEIAGILVLGHIISTNNKLKAYGFVAFFLLVLTAEVLA